ncbi:hypothetical protein FSP39_012499 [Pinctada imbricata]|uniref:Uncharacterized protein n=1 Tax=Pinctada imbricata TaxID=66713 RepID=A0AA89BLY4_PINIB|nr:hypothetical protein FSP39_012499 [Pinctada imbricata]
MADKPKRRISTVDPKKARLAGVAPVENLKEKQAPGKQRIGIEFIMQIEVVWQPVLSVVLYYCSHGSKGK